MVQDSVTDSLSWGQLGLDRGNGVVAYLFVCFIFWVLRRLDIKDVVPNQAAKSSELIGQCHGCKFVFKWQA